ncbi:hypothetical protein B0H14DRAFT_501071 [Mycena olivaceomarginata]|nr:hypothetical protein B0H14DRAFT_501071 [Mycena olivaceomarginata]
MRTVLLPVFRNIVRRLIVECVLDAADADATVEAGLSASRKPLDPAMGAERMNLADVVRQLREEGMWFDGMDRSAERRNARRRMRRTSSSVNARRRRNAGIARRGATTLWGRCAQMPSPVLSIDARNDAEPAAAWGARARGKAAEGEAGLRVCGVQQDSTPACGHS